METIISMLIVFKRKVIIRNCHLFTLEKPSIKSPNSSGNGKAIIITPMIGISHAKRGLFNVLTKKLL